jgi:signal transduction histidine kinase
MTVWGRLSAAARRQPHADVGIALVVLAVTVVTTSTDPQGAPPDLPALAAAAVACGALAARRRFPPLVLAVSAVAAEVYLIHGEGHRGSMVLAAPLIALYTVAETSTRRRALFVGVLVMLAFAGIHTLIKPTSWINGNNLALAALGGLAVAAGDASRSRRAYLLEAQARAEHAEADRDAEAARRVTEERLRIARDLHDMLGHHLALIHVQARVAEHTLDGATDTPARARDALEAIGTASKTALGELGDTIGLLRRPGEPSAPTAPVSGLAGVDALLDAFRRSGLTVTEQVDGQVRAIAVAADLTAYRVLQESLTNVRKHAGPTAVTVRLSYEPDALRIVVDNPATAPDTAAGHWGRSGRERETRSVVPNGTGHGLVGMRERVTALGGTLRAGPRPDGGYRVTAVLPAPAGRAP